MLEGTRIFMSRLNFSKVIHFFAFGLGTGLCPKGPGTMGTLLAVPIFWVFSHLSPINYLMVLTVMIGCGIYICGVTARDLKQPDDSRIVWDEICGYLVSMFMVPAQFGLILAGFILFRAIDIFKPWPIGSLEQRIHGGIGIMLDDLLAGIVVCLILHSWLSFNPGI